MAETNPTPRRNRVLISANVLVQIIAVFVLVAIANWFVSRHYTRLDWTKSGYYNVSDKTKQMLGALKEPLKVIVYLQPTVESDLDVKIFSDVRNLLNEFKFYGKDKLDIEYVDPDRNLARAREIVEKYKFDVREPALVIFAYGDRSKYVSKGEMAETEGGSPYGGPPTRIKSFKAEGAFLSAIQTVTEGAPATVTFLTGHGERDPADFNQRTGLSTLAAYIKRDNLTVEKWNLLEQQGLPTNTAAMVIAGPRTPYTGAELAALDKFLENHGRLYLLLDPHTATGLEGFLLKWGVLVDDDLAMRKAGALLGTQLLDINAVGATYAPHPVTARLTGVNTEFPEARSVRKSKAEPASATPPIVTELVTTGPTYWGETDRNTEASTFDPAADIAGPLPLAVAVETGKPRDLNVDLGETRLIIVGTGSFVDNSSLTAGNLDFFMSGLNWLLQRDQMLAVGPKVPAEFSLKMTPRQVYAVWSFVVVGLPFCIGVAGFVVWLRRRK